MTGLPAWLRLGYRRSLPGAAGAAVNAHFAAGANQHLPGKHDALIRGKPDGNDDIVALALAELYRTQFRGVIRLSPRRQTDPAG